MDGLTAYDRLPQPPGWLPVAYFAAVAAFNAGLFDRAQALAQDFLRRAAAIPELAHQRAAAKALLTESRRVARALRARGQRTSPMPDSRETRAGNSTAPRAASTSTATFSPPAQPPRHRGTSREHDADARTAAADTAPASIDPPTSVPSANDEPGHGLPAFPIIDVPDVEARIVFDGSDAFETAAPPVPAGQVLLRRDYAALRLQRGFDELISLRTVRDVEPFWFQRETVRRVLRHFRGRVLLADEVGLGKTIEACLALKEYWLRGLVRRALVLTPAALVRQWVDELTSKFGMPPAVVDSSTPRARIERLLPQESLVVASLPLLRQTAYQSCLAPLDYDLVIVDEAHTLKNRTSAAFALVNGLKKRFLFLLSATPVGNDLRELYNLILLLKPGLLKTEAEFAREFGGAGALEDPARRERLRSLLREVMIRNTRAHIDLRLPRRLAATEIVRPSDAEAHLQESLAAFVRERYDGGDAAERFRLMSLQAQAGSSPAALRSTLEGGVGAEPDHGLARVRAALAGVAIPSKTAALIALARRSADKKLVFTRFLATLEHLRHALTDAGFRVAVLHGRQGASDKEAAVEAFAADAEILLSSEVGSEGRNLQFCRTVVNYDLPWNPVQLEQRVGRVHRIGQTRDVFVFNLCLAGSLEEYVLKVLHEKLNLFELVAGEIEMILGEFDADHDFATVVMDLWARAATPADRDRAFAALADGLAAARARYDRTLALDRSLFRQEFEV